MTHFNVSEDDSLEMSQEDINTHLAGVVMLQQFSLKANLQHFGKKGEEPVRVDTNAQHGDLCTYRP